MNISGHKKCGKFFPPVFKILSPHLKVLCTILISILVNFTSKIALGINNTQLIIRDLGMPELCMWLNRVLQKTLTFQGLENNLQV